MQTFYNYFMPKPLVNYKRAKKVLKYYDTKTGRIHNKDLQEWTKLFLRKGTIYQRIIKPLFVLSLISVCFVWIVIVINLIFNLY